LQQPAENYLQPAVFRGQLTSRPLKYGINSPVYNIVAVRAFRALIQVPHFSMQFFKYLPWGKIQENNP
jgi:hypothetical protein